MGDSQLHVHLDLIGGLAGDMFLAAAIDAGVVEPGEVQRALRQVGLGDIVIHTERITRGAIEGTHVEFSGWDPHHESDHRHLSEIRKMLAASELPPAVRARAAEMFERLGEVEAHVHGIELERVHFHEVGAVDSILDFVAAAWIIETTASSWSVGTIPVGSGTIETAHGTIPVPAPATAELLKGFEVEYRDVEAELVTPTGATIAATVAAMQGQRRGTVASTGFGCGTRRLENLSNVVRFVVLSAGEHAREESERPDGVDSEQVIRLVTEIDDQSPELIAYAAEALMEAGALDVVRQPVQMKKGRLGERLAVLCRPEHEARLVERIFAETTTLGIRREPVERWVLPRESDTVETPFGEVTVKVAYRGDEVSTVSPEYESCAQIARREGVAVRQVYRAALEA